MEVMNDELYIAGYFDNVNGIPASKFAKWDGNQWHYLNCFFSNAISSISSMNGEMYIGGAFNIVNGITVNKVCKYTPAPVGVSEIESFDIKVFPNPAKDKINFRLNTSFKNGVIQLYDSRGKLVNAVSFSGYLQSISTHNLASGFYHYCVSDNKGLLNKGKISIVK